MLPALLGAVVLAIYGLSMNRDIGFWDTGEFQTVPYILGLAHANGFPTEILLGWAFTHVIPFDSPAQRMTDLSIIYGALSAVACYGISSAVGAIRPVAFTIALCFATNAIEWIHATRADVIDPAVAFSSASILAAIAATGSSKLRDVVFSALLAGAALGTHAVVIFYLPTAFLWIVFYSRPSRRLRYGGLWLVTSSCTATAFYSYIILRSQYVEAHSLDPSWALGTGFDTPIWNWGEPDTIPRLWGVMTGNSVGGGSSLVHAFSIGSLFANLRTILTQIRGTETSLGLASVSIAAVAFVIKKRVAAVIMILPLLLTAPFAAAFAAESDTARYYLLPNLLLWSLAGVSLTQFRSVVSTIFKGPTATLAVLALPLAFAGLNIYRSLSLFQQPNDRLASNYIDAVRKNTSPNSVIIAPWVYATPLTYESYVTHGLDQRIVVPGDIASTTDAQSGIWSSGRPVFAIAEQPPATADRCALVLEFHINPDTTHDPRLFRCLKN